jgi:hypothetical protein
MIVALISKVSKMDNHIEKILNHPKGSPRWKASRLRWLALEASDRGNERLAHDYYSAADTVIDPKTNKPFPIVRSYPTEACYEPNSSRVIVAHEKYGDRYLAASDFNQIAHSCLSLLQERLDWYSNQLPEGEDPGPQLDMFKSNKVPLTDRQYAEKILNIAKEDTGFLFAGRLALIWLYRDRQSHEYENIEFIYPETPTFETGEDNGS